MNPERRRLTNRPWLVKLLLVIAGTGFSLVIAEGLVRLVFPHTRDTAIPGHLFVIDDVLGWKFRANRSSVHRTRHFAVEYSINDLGYRDGPRPSLRNSPGRRLLLYGDSLMFGWGVPQGDRFSDLLEQKTPGLEMWNHAVPGYGIDQELLSYEKDAESLLFDEAMFFVARGTLERTHYEYIYAKYKPMFSYEAGHRLALKPVPAFRNWGVSLLYDTFSPFYLLYFVQNQVSLISRFAISHQVAPSADSKYVDALAEAILLRAHKTIQDRSQHMSVLVGDIWGDDREELRRFCEANEIDFYEIPTEISATSTIDERMDLVLGLYDRHWNSKANRLIADELERKRADGNRSISDLKTGSPYETISHR